MRWARKEATREDATTGVLNKEKEKAVEANNEKDLDFDQGHITGKGYLAEDFQFPDDQVFYGKKGKKDGKTGGKKGKDAFKSSKKGKSSKSDAGSSPGGSEA